MIKSYYKHNQKYSRMLNTGTLDIYSVYTFAVKKFISNKGKFLDIGCGPGLVVDGLTKLKIDALGIEISQSSLSIAKKRSGKYKLYSGKKIPFPDSSFNVVGSFNVLEHVEDVSLVLNESVRVLRLGGFLIIGAPNFLSLTNSYHHRTAGVTRKILNFLSFVKKVIGLFTKSTPIFEKFEPISRVDFHPDDDATNLINPIDLFKWGMVNNMKIIEYAGSILPKGYLSHLLGQIPIINLFTGGVFVVFKKMT